MRKTLIFKDLALGSLFFSHVVVENATCSNCNEQGMDLTCTKLAQNECKFNGKGYRRIQNKRAKSQDKNTYFQRPGREEIVL